MEDENVKPIYQTIFGPENGNCLQATVASIFEEPLENVPHFCEGMREDWQEVYDAWLQKRGLQLMTVDARSCRRARWVPRGYHVIAGQSPRFDRQHAVVGLSGEVVHDPHPEAIGLDTEETWDVFVITLTEEGNE